MSREEKDMYKERPPRAPAAAGPFPGEGRVAISLCA